MERAINQRIKFLLENLNLSARDFSRAVGVPDNNTQNYLEPRYAQPKADYLEKVLLHFESINSSWLLTGKGEPFLPNSSPPNDSNNIQSKNFSGNVAHKVSGNQTQNNGISLLDIEKERDTYKAQLDASKEQIELLRQLLAAKDETIALLRSRT